MAAGDEQDLIEAVVTCEGNLHDPDFQDRFRALVNKLKTVLYISKTKDPFRVRKIEPWNSVRVTISIPKEAAQKLKLLAQQGSNVLRSMGILSVQVEGDQVISLTWANHNNEATQVILRQASDEAGTSSGTSGVSSSSLPASSPSISSMSSSVASISSPIPLTPGSSAEAVGMAVTLDMLSSPSSSAFRSPNVVAPCGESIPVLPPKTPAAGVRPALGGPFPFVSMTHAAQAIQRSELSPMLNSNNIVISSNNTSNSNAANSTNSIASSVPSSSSLRLGTCKPVQPSQSNAIPETLSTNPTSSTSVSPVIVSTSACSVVTTVNVNSESQVTRLIIENSSALNPTTQVVGNNVALGLSGNNNVARSQAGPSQSLQLQLVNVPPPYPGVNTISSNHSISSASSSSGILTSNIQSRQQHQPALISNVGVGLSVSGPTNPSLPTTVTMGMGSTASINRTGGGNIGEVPSTAPVASMSDNTIGVPSLAQPVSSPLLVNLLQNNDISPASTTSANAEAYNQQQMLQKNINIPVQTSGASDSSQQTRYLLQQQQQLKKVKRGLSLDGASPVSKNVPVGALGGSESVLPAVTDTATQSKAPESYQFALPLPSETGSPVTLNRVSIPVSSQNKQGNALPNQVASDQNAATLLQGRTIVQGNSIRFFDQGSGQVRTIPLQQQQPPPPPYPATGLSSLTLQGKTVVSGLPVNSASSHNQLSDQVTGLTNGPLLASSLSQLTGTNLGEGGSDAKSQLMATVTLVSSAEQHTIDHDVTRASQASSAADQSRTLLPITTVNIVSKSSSKSNSKVNNSNKDSDSKTFIPPPDPRLSSQVQKLSYSNSVSAKNSAAASNMVVQTAGYNTDAKSSTSQLHPAGRTLVNKRTSKDRPTTFHSQIASTGKPRQFLINPLTGHLEPMPSESSSESEGDDGEGEAGRKANSLKGSLYRNKSGRGLPFGIHHRQIVTTESGVTVARVIKTSVDANLAQSSGEMDGRKPAGQLQLKGNPIGNSSESHNSSSLTHGTTVMSVSKKSREDSTAAALQISSQKDNNNPSPATVTATSVTGEKIKLRLKLEKSEPISPAYKVDVSFVKKSEKGSVLPSGGSLNPSAAASSAPVSSASGQSNSGFTDQPRVPPLHISLRGKNAAVVVSPRREEKDIPPSISGNTKDPVVSNKDMSTTESSTSSLLPQHAKSHILNSHEGKSGGKSGGKRTKSRVKSLDDRGTVEKGSSGEKVKAKISRPKLSKEVSSSSSRSLAAVDDCKDIGHLTMPVLQPAVVLPAAVDTPPQVDKNTPPVVKPDNKEETKAKPLEPLVQPPDSPNKLLPNLMAAPDLTVGACQQQQPTSLGENEKTHLAAADANSSEGSTKTLAAVTPLSGVEVEEKVSSVNPNSEFTSFPESSSVVTEVACSSQSFEMDQLPQVDQVFKGAFSSEFSSYVSASEDPKMIIDSSRELVPQTNIPTDESFNPVINLPTVSCDIKCSENQVVSEKEDLTGFDSTLTSHSESPALLSQGVEIPTIGATPMEVNEGQHVESKNIASTAAEVVEPPSLTTDTKLTTNEDLNKDSDISKSCHDSTGSGESENKSCPEEIILESMEVEISAVKAVETQAQEHVEHVEAPVVQDEVIEAEKELEISPHSGNTKQEKEEPATNTSKNILDRAIVESLRPSSTDVPHPIETELVSHEDNSSLPNIVTEKEHVTEQPTEVESAWIAPEECVFVNQSNETETPCGLTVEKEVPISSAEAILEKNENPKSPSAADFQGVLDETIVSRTQTIDDINVSSTSSKIEATPILEDVKDLYNEEVSTPKSENVESVSEIDDCITVSERIGVDLDAKDIAVAVSACETTVLTQSEPEIEDEKEETLNLPGHTNSSNTEKPLEEMELSHTADISSVEMKDISKEEIPTISLVSTDGSDVVTDATKNDQNDTKKVDLETEAIKESQSMVEVSTVITETPTNLTETSMMVEKPPSPPVITSVSESEIPPLASAAIMKDVSCNLSTSAISVPVVSKEETCVVEPDVNAILPEESNASDVIEESILRVSTKNTLTVSVEEVTEGSEESAPEQPEPIQNAKRTVPGIIPAQGKSVLAEPLITVTPVPVKDMTNTETEPVDKPGTPAGNEGAIGFVTNDALKSEPSNNNINTTSEEYKVTSVASAPQLVSCTLLTEVVNETEQQASQIKATLENVCERDGNEGAANIAPVSVAIMKPKKQEMPAAVSNAPPISIVLPSESLLRASNPDGKSGTSKNAYKRRAEIKPGALQNTLKRLHDNLPKVLKTSDKQDPVAQPNIVVSDADEIETPITTLESARVQSSGTIARNSKPVGPLTTATSPTHAVNVPVSPVRPIANVMQRVKPVAHSPTIRQIPPNFQPNILTSVSVSTGYTSTALTTVTSISVPSSTSGGQPQTVYAIHPNVSIPANFAHLQQSPVVLPGGHKMVPIKLVTLPKQSGGQLQTIPLGNATPNRSSPNLLEAVNIVANAGSRSSSPKTTLLGSTMQTTPLNLSSMSLPVGGNLHFVPISVSSATGTTGNVKVLMTQPIKMQQAGLSQSMVVKSVLMGSQPTTIRVIRPANLQDPISIQTLIKPAEHTTKPKTSLPSKETCMIKNDFTVQQDSLFKKLDGVEIVETGSPLNNDDLPFEADIIHDEKDLADVLAAEAKNEVVPIENCSDFRIEVKANDEISLPSVKTLVGNTFSAETNTTGTVPIVQNHVSSKKLLHLNREDASTPESPVPVMRVTSPLFTYPAKMPQDTRPSPPPSGGGDGPDIHGEDQEIINSFSRSQSRLSPQPKSGPHISVSAKSPNVDLLPDHTYGLSAGVNDVTKCDTNNLDQELSIEIPSMDLEVITGSPSQNPPEEKRCTRSTRSNTRLSPDITAFMSDTPKPAKSSAKPDSLVLRNSPKPSPTGSLKVLSPTPSSLTITPSTSTRSSPILHTNQHQINSSNAAATINAVALGIIDKIQGNSSSTKNLRVSKLSGTNKRKRQESDSSSASRDENLEEKTEIDLNSRPGKRKCSENAAEMIKVCIGVEDSPKRNSALQKKTDEIKSKDGKGKKIMAAVVEDDDDVDSEVSNSRGRSGRSSRESSEDRSSSRGSSAQRVISIEKSKSGKEEEPTKDVKASRVNSRAGKEVTAKSKLLSGRSSPNQGPTPAKKAKESGKNARRPNRPNSKDKSPFTPAKTRTNVRKDVINSQTPSEKNTPAATPSANPENENARRKTRSSAAVDTPDSELSHVKRRRISKDANS